MYHSINVKTPLKSVLVIFNLYLKWSSDCEPTLQEFHVEKQIVHPKTTSLWLLENCEGEWQNSLIIKHVENSYCMQNVGCSNLGRKSFIAKHSETWQGTLEKGGHRPGCPLVVLVFMVRWRTLRLRVIIDS